jgi:hypothetical protein
VELALKRTMRKGCEGSTSGGEGSLTRSDGVGKGSQRGDWPGGGRRKPRTAGVAMNLEIKSIGIYKVRVFLNIFSLLIFSFLSPLSSSEFHIWHEL